MITHYLRLALERKTLVRAIRVAMLVGIILNLINNPSLFFAYSRGELNLGRILLTFLVPYCVSTYSSVLSGSNLSPGSVSHLDAILKCKSCKKTNFHVHIGQAIEECPQCKKKTRWKLSKIFSSENSNNEMLKSLALFARYNPQPLFRIDSQGIILGANPASEKFLDRDNVIGLKLEEYIPEVANLNLGLLIQNDDVEDLLVSHSGRFYKLVLRGVQVLHSGHVYGNDITEIVLAERKIKAQAREIQESINYAWRIQQAMLPADNFISAVFPACFTFYRPRNTVSGDFYWVNKIGNLRFVAVADCTGHGVPGAFMSMMGISMLNEIILREKTTNPAGILNVLRERLILSLKTENKKTKVFDGMDISLAVIDEETKLLTFAGAYNPLYLLRNGELIIMKADRMPVGEYVNDSVSFTEKTITTQSSDRLVLFTDGYKDQNGGKKNKKLGSRFFKEILTETSELSFKKQSHAIETTFDNWKKEYEQVDDVLLLGIELS